MLLLTTSGDSSTFIVDFVNLLAYIMKQPTNQFWFLSNNSEKWCGSFCRACKQGITTTQNFRTIMVITIVWSVLTTSNNRHREGSSQNYAQNFSKLMWINLLLFPLGTLVGNWSAKTPWNSFNTSELWSLSLTNKAENGEYIIFMDNLYSIPKYLTYFMPLVTLYTPWKHYKTRGFWCFQRAGAGGKIEKDQWQEMV